MSVDIFSRDDERASRMTKLKSPTDSDATKSETRSSVFAVLALAGCSSHHHHGMASEGKGDAYWQKG